MEQHYDEATRFTVTCPNPQIMENLIISAIEQRDLHRADILMYSAAGVWTVYMQTCEDKNYAIMYMCHGVGCSALANSKLVNTPRILFPRSCGAGVLSMYDISEFKGAAVHVIANQAIATAHIDMINGRATTKAAMML